jgi:hypothetical protein
MLPGAAALEARYRGAVSVGGMPLFRKTEISDQEIEALALCFA